MNPRVLLTPLALAALLAGCADVSAPPAVAHPPSLFGEVEGRPAYVFNTQLRAAQPADRAIPASRAWGHLQIRLIPPDVGDAWTLEWKGRVHDPAGEPFTDGSIYAIGEVDGRPVVRLFGGRGEACAFGEVDGSQAIPAGLARRMIDDPNLFEARFITERGGAIVGRFGRGAPDTRAAPGMRGRPEADMQPCVSEE